jgi:hypothetical protein
MYGVKFNMSTRKSNPGQKETEQKQIQDREELKTKTNSGKSAYTGIEKRRLKI